MVGWSQTGDLNVNIDRETRLKRIGETVDRLMTLDLWCKFAGEDVVLGMYEAALEAVKPRSRSLSLAAAEALVEGVKAGNQVLICTGLVLPPWMVAESDGPGGAAVLARMLNLAIKSSPVILVAPRWVDAVRQVVIAAGITPIDNPNGLKGKRGACAVVGFPTDDAAAGGLAQRWIGSGDVAAVVAIETPGRTPSGRYLTGAHELDISTETARFDYLFEEANARDILTIGIGDHGGELGLGTIAEAVRRIVPTARARPGLEGIAPVVPSKIPLIAGVSNWGAYALAACLAAVTEQPELVHDGAAERRIIRAGAQAGLLAGMVGLPIPVVDGLSEEINVSYVEFLRTAVQRGMEAPYPRAVGFTPNL